MANRAAFPLGFAAVAVSMTVLFVLPQGYFIAGTFAATSVMIVAAAALGGFTGFRPDRRALAIGVLSAAALYCVFYAGNSAVDALSLPGVSASKETAIYSLIASPSNPFPLQVGVLAFDAVGYEAFFRSTLQKRLQTRLGWAAAPVVAVVDSALHIATMNLLWVATTFVADLVWGLTYRYGKGLPSSVTSHFLWDVAIFIIRPIG